jgi:hypothetical protein
MTTNTTSPTVIIPGHVNPIMNAVIPAAMAHRLMGGTAVEAASGR